MTLDEPGHDPLQQRVPLAPPVFAPPQAETTLPVPPLVQPTDPAPPSVPPQQPRRTGAIIALSIACSILLLTTIGLGVTTAITLWGSPIGIAQPEPTPTSTAEAAPEVQGHPVIVTSDLTIDHFALDPRSDLSTLYALVTNEDADQTAQASFDITAYDADGRILHRNIDLVFVFPGETTMLDASFLDPITGVDHFTIEQTSIDWVTPTATAGIAIVEARTGEGVVEADLTSTAAAATEFSEVYFAVFVDEEIIGVCYDYVDLPAGETTLTARCRLDAAYAEDEVDVEDLPADAVVDVFLKLDWLFAE